MKRNLFFGIFPILCCISCFPSVGVFEKNVTIPEQKWESNFNPAISFDIEDTAGLYNIYLVLRHSDAYNFNNIWIKGTVQQPGDTATHSAQYDLPLATNNKWLGSAMDDIYENRILLQAQTKFKKPGTYHFTISQVMREDPLLHVLNVGLRVEKAK